MVLQIINNIIIGWTFWDRDPVRSVSISFLVHESVRDFLRYLSPPSSKLSLLADKVCTEFYPVWNTFTDTPSHPLYQLLPPKKQRFLRNRGHDFILPALKQNALIGVFLILFNCTWSWIDCIVMYVKPHLCCDYQLWIKTLMNKDSY